MHQARVDQQADREARARIVEPELDRLTAFVTRNRETKDMRRLREASGSRRWASCRDPFSDTQLLTTGEGDLDGSLVEPVDRGSSRG
jgi:hypothetical protein